MKIQTIFAVLLYLQCVTTAVRAVEVNINLDKPLFEVEPEFLSVTIDCGILSPPKWKTFNFSSPRVQTLMRGLSPAYLRFGGTSADYVVFSNEPVQVFEKSGLGLPLHVYNDTDIDDIVKLMRNVNFKLLLDLNLQLRYGQQWDPTNAAKLLGYVNKMKYHDVFNFELGNEPDLFHEHGPVVTLNGTRIGKDFTILHNLLTQYSFKNFTFVGPDSANIFSQSAIDLFTDFLKEAGSYLTAAAFHHYYFNGKVANVSEYTETKNFDEYDKRINVVKDIIKKSKTPDLALWLGEGADAYGGGTPNISDRYVSGFLWLDKLGLSAKEGMGVVMRQTFYGGHYSLTDVNNQPNPDYWLSYLHKKLVGQKVLNVSTTSTSSADTTLYFESFWDWIGLDPVKPPQDIRVYAHCTQVYPGSRYRKGSVTVFALSVKKSENETLTFPAPLSSHTVDVYLLTPVGSDGIKSKQVALNGKTLQLIDDHTLPQLIPAQQPASRGIRLPALTFGFFVFPNANAAACK